MIDSKFAPWRSEADHATSRSRRLPTILIGPVKENTPNNQSCVTLSINLLLYSPPLIVLTLKYCISWRKSLVNHSNIQPTRLLWKPEFKRRNQILRFSYGIDPMFYLFRCFCFRSIWTTHSHGSREEDALRWRGYAKRLPPALLRRWVFTA